MFFGLIGKMGIPVVRPIYEINEGEIDFEENAYVVNFETSTFDFYCGSELVKAFNWDDLPKKAEDFPNVNSDSDEDDDENDEEEKKETKDKDGKENEDEDEDENKDEDEDENQDEDEDDKEKAKDKGK